MANAKVTWVLPTTRESGALLKVEDIKHVRIEVSADGTNFGLIGDFKPDVTETTVEGLDPGTWAFRGLVADTKGRVSAPAISTVTVEDTTPPSPLTLSVELYLQS